MNINNSDCFYNAFNDVGGFEESTIKVIIY